MQAMMCSWNGRGGLLGHATTVQMNVSGGGGGGDENCRAHLGACLGEGDADDVHDGDVAVADEPPRVVIAADAQRLRCGMAARDMEEVHARARGGVQQRQGVAGEGHHRGRQSIDRDPIRLGCAQQLAVVIIHLHKHGVAT